jgi:hypothetical protein
MSMKRGPNLLAPVQVLGASARAEIAEENDRAGNRTYIELLDWRPVLSNKNVGGLLVFKKETTHTELRPTDI